MAPIVAILVPSTLDRPVSTLMQHVDTLSTELKTYGTALVLGLALAACGKPPEKPRPPRST